MVHLVLSSTKPAPPLLGGTGVQRLKLSTLIALLVLVTSPVPALALNRFCDVAFEDCRTPLIQLIDNETQRIDVAFWFMEDARYSAALFRAAQRGVKIRVIFDSEELNGQTDRQFVIDQLIAAGIPIRDKVDPGIAHWKMMIFTAQNTVEFSGGNYSAEAFVPETPYSAYEDEVIYFTEDASLLASFKTKFEDVWTSTNGMMANYANVTTLERVHPIVSIDPRLNFVPFDSFRDRSVATYRAETQRIDAIIYRITDRAHTDALIENVQRGIPLRLITEPNQYRDESRLWHAWNVDRLYMAGLQNPINGQPGIQIRHRQHQGLTHEKLSLMIGQGMTVFGSSNWTSPSSEYQLEHNLFTTDPVFFAWARDHFERKWNNLGPSPETQPFQPQGPDTPVLGAPADGSTGQSTSITLDWHAGPWAHKYDLFLGTDRNNLVKIINDEELGPYDLAVTLNGLTAGTRYYWYVVSRTMANLTRQSDVHSFVTAGSAPGNGAPSITITSPSSGASFTAPASIPLAVNATDPDGFVARVDYFANSNPIASSTTAPFTATWLNAPAGTYSVTARATDNLGATTTSTPISVTVGSAPSGLPAPWADQDIGGVGQAGSASVNGGTFSVTGSGTDVWGTTDQFHFVFQALNGDGSVVARIPTVQPVDVWTKAGVMIRESLTAGSRHAFMLSSPGSTKGLAFQRRIATNDISTSTGLGGAPPTWVKLTRAGTVFSAYVSADGVNWTLVGSDTISMPTAVYAGLAVSSHNNAALATATFDNVSVTSTVVGPPPNVPPSVALTSPNNGATFNAPASITLTATASDSDGTIAKVDFYSGSTLLQTTTSPYSMTLNGVTAGSYTFTARATDNAGAETTSSAVTIQVVAAPPPGIPAPWAQEDIGGPGQPGNGSVSGSTWSVSGGGADVWGTADQFHFVYQPLSGDGSVVARVATVQQVDVWTKAGVMIRESLAPGSRQAFMLSTPGITKGLAFQRRVATDGISTNDATAGAPPTWVKLTRTGSVISAYRSDDGSNWTLVGSDTIPMASTVLAGLAVSAHNNSALASATFDNVSVTPAGSGPAANVPPSVSLTSPGPGSSFTAPASITLTASAADTDGTVAKVDFYVGGTLLQTDTTSPYSITWSNVAAGSYTLTARATDNAGAVTTSSSVNIQVTAPAPGLPAGWSNQDIGGVGAAGSTTFSGGVFTLRGSGTDIWGTADAFQFAYRAMTGDGTIVAHVQNVEFVDRWTKAGVMIRASVAPGSKQAMMVVSPGKGSAFQRRVTDNGDSVNTAGPFVAAPAWVRLQRTGTLFTASISMDGTNWTVVGTETIDMPATVLVGLPLTSHLDGAVATATLDSVTITP
jgi:regulation of enolase protein 1 (concanavalin A-like superfamily)/phosphatidylserine/phosphatidylglycerophosphate/cardiolipin synthase-like enzyme